MPLSDTAVRNAKPGASARKMNDAGGEVQDAADAWLTDYNECRPHGSLGNRPPALFRPRVFNQEVSTSEPST